ncbi:MAG: methionyl-tRNA formyltransferase, partial [Syntrophothermus sp.]
MDVQHTPVEREARRLALPVFTPKTLKDADEQATFRAHAADAAVVVAYGLILPEPILTAPRLGFLNVHASLLPRWRGAAPIERAIMAGEERTGVCVMRLTAGLDSGPVGPCEEVPIGAEEDFEQLAARLAERGGELLVRALDAAAAGTLRFAEQDDAAATYAEKIDPAERRLDPGRPAAELAAKVRALGPHVGVYLQTADGSRLGVRRARAVPGAGPGAGTVAAAAGAIVLGCGEGSLRLEVVQPPGGRPMPADDYLRGHPLPEPA